MKVSNDNKKEVKTSESTQNTPSMEKQTREESIKDQEIKVEREDAFQSLVKKVEELTREKATGGMSADDIVKIIKATKTEETTASGKLISSDDIDPEDELEAVDSVNFFAPTCWYVIVDDIRQNRAVYPPISEAISFEYAGAERVMTEKGATNNVFSQYNSRSKKEVKWLREHRLFNVIFFEDQQIAIDVDHAALMEMHKAFSTVESMEPNSVRDLLKASDITPGTSHQNNKKLLAIHIAKEKASEIASKEKSMRMYSGSKRGLDEMDLLGMKSRTPVKRAEKV